MKPFICRVCGQLAADGDRQGILCEECADAQFQKQLYDGYVIRKDELFLASPKRWTPDLKKAWRFDDWKEAEWNAGNEDKDGIPPYCLIVELRP
jgi:hypothetical protein